MVTLKEKISRLSHLQCSTCEKMYPADEVNTVASCPDCSKNVLISVYEHLSGMRRTDIETGERSMWRYFPLLPVYDKKNIVSLGEGLTPILQLNKMGSRLGLEKLFVKDESFNPTGSFKARGMSAAVSKAKELGLTKCIVPTAGNAGGALGAYCAKAGMKAIVVMPHHTPAIFKKECLMYGAELILQNGLISDCAKKVKEINKNGEYFNVSTLQEPYRLEGKKTMGYEIAEQLNWQLPDVILYPTGGGTGLIGMWKAFHEMIEMEWIPPRLPRMIAVQSDQCNPIMETWLGHQSDSSEYQGSATLANGLAVPNPFGEKMILQILRESRGKPVSVSDAEIIASTTAVARAEGMLFAPEGGALIAALGKLAEEGYVGKDESVLLMNTGSGYKYLEIF